MQQAKYLSWLVTLLLIILLPSPAIAGSFYVSPSEVYIKNLSPGDVTEFEFSIYNKENESYVFNLITYLPEDTELRQGRSTFPDNNWISVPKQIEVPANSEREITVKIAIPQKQELSEKDWEAWLRIAPERTERLTVNYYIRLLISTDAETIATYQLKPILVISTTLLLVYGAYLIYRKVKLAPGE